MRITKRQLRRIIEQNVAHDLEAEYPADIEPRENAYAGGDNLALNINHATAVSDIDDEEVPSSPEEQVF